MRSPSFVVVFVLLARGCVGLRGDQNETNQHFEEKFDRDLEAALAECSYPDTGRSHGHNSTDKCETDTNNRPSSTQHRSTGNGHKRAANTQTDSYNGAQNSYSTWGNRYNSQDNSQADDTYSRYNYPDNSQTDTYNRYNYPDNSHTDTYNRAQNSYTTSGNRYNSQGNSPADTYNRYNNAKMSQTDTYNRAQNSQSSAGNEHNSRSSSQNTDNGHNSRKSSQNTDNGRDSRSSSQNTDNGRDSRSSSQNTDNGHNSRSSSQNTDNVRDSRSSSQNTDNGHNSRSSSQNTDNGRDSAEEDDRSRRDDGDGNSSVFIPFSSGNKTNGYRYRERAPQNLHTGGTRLTNYTRGSGGHPKVTRSTYDARSDDIPACTVLCVLATLKVVDARGAPVETSLVKLLEDGVSDRRRRHSLVKRVSACFKTTPTDQSDDNCSLARTFTHCFGFKLDKKPSNNSSHSEV